MAASGADRPRIVVTGGNGFYGSHIIPALKEQYADCLIYVLDQRPPAVDNPDVERYYTLDILNKPEVAQALEEVRPDAVVHTAGITCLLHQRYNRGIEKRLKEVNVGGTQVVLEAASQAGCKAFVFTSSCCAVTDDLHGYFANINESYPVSRKSLMYGESKVEAEELVFEADSPEMATCIIRPAVTFGEGEYILVPSIHACIAKWETPFRIGDGQNLWDTVYVGNVAYAHALAVRNLLTTKSAHGEAFFIQNNEPITFREFSLAVWREFGHCPPFEVGIPASLGMVMGAVSEVWTWLCGTTTTICRGSVLDATAMRYASGEKARRILGYEARVGLEEGLRRSCKEYSQRLRTQGQERQTSQ